MILKLRDMVKLRDIILTDMVHCKSERTLYIKTSLAVIDCRMPALGMMP